MRDSLDLIERLATVLRSDGRVSLGDTGLQPIHLDMLRYLDRCNRYSDTPGAVTEFLGLTKGTVSQSLQVLERKGLVERRPDDADGRVVHLSLTQRGRRLSRSGPGPDWVEAFARLSTVRRRELEDGLRSLLTAVQRSRGGRAFGACHTCGFFRREDHGFRCGLTEEPLSDFEIVQLCRENEPCEAAR